jgi:hypothetical protein
MNNTATADPDSHEVDDMCAEYSLDYSKARPNRFAGRIDRNRLVVVLDPDISEVFTTPESVNAVLRALIATMPTVRHRAIRESGHSTDEEART